MVDIVVNFVGTANFAAVKAQVAELQATLAKVDSKFMMGGGMGAAQLSNAKAIESQMVASIAATKGFNIEQVALGQSTATLTEKFVKHKFTLQELFTMGKAGWAGQAAEINAVAAAQAKLSGATFIPSAARQDMAYMVTTGREVATAAETAAIKQKLYNTTIQDLGTKVTDLGKNTQWAGRQLTVGLTMPLLAAGAALATMYYHVDQNLRMLSRVYGIGGNFGGMYQNIIPSDAQIADIKNKVMQVSQEMAKMYGVDAKDTTAVAAALASAGYTQQTLLNMTKEVTKAMVLGNVDEQTAIKGTIALQNAYKLNSAQVRDAVNFMSATQASTVTTMSDVINAIPRVGPIVHELGGNIQTTTAMLVAMKEGGVQASDGANALKTGLGRLIEPTSAAEKLFAKYNINLKELVKTHQGDIVGMITALQTALGNLSPLEKAQAMVTLFGKFQFARMTALMDNFNRSGTQSAKVMQMAGLSAQQLQEIVNHETAQIQQSSSYKFKATMEELKVSLLPLGRVALNVFTDIMKVISTIGHFISILSPYKNILGVVLGGVAIAGPILMIIGLLQNLSGFVIRLFNDIRMMGQGFGQGAREAEGFFGTIKGAMTGAIAGRQNFFKEVDKSLLATQSLANSTKTVVESQGESLQWLTTVIDRFNKAIESNIQLGGTSSMLALGATTGIVRPGAKAAPSSAPPASTSGSESLAAETRVGAAAMQASMWSRIGPNAGGDKSMFKDPRVLMDANTMNTILAPNRLNYGNTNGKISDNMMLYRAGVDDRAAIEAKVAAIARAEGVEEQNIADLLKRIVVSTDDWAKLEATHLTTLDMINKNENGIGDAILAELKQWQLATKGVEDQNLLIEASNTYTTKINTILESVAGFEQQRDTKAKELLALYDKMGGAVNASVVILDEGETLSAEINTKYKEVSAGVNKLGYAVRAAAQQMTMGLSSALSFTNSKVVGSERLHIIPSSGTMDAAVKLMPAGPSYMGGVLQKAIYGQVDALTAETAAVNEAAAQTLTTKSTLADFNAILGTTGTKFKDIASQLNVELDVNDNTIAIKKKLIAAIQTEIDSTLVLAETNAAVAAEESGQGGAASGGMLSRIRGRLKPSMGGMGIGMAAMMLPMLTQPVGRAVGGTAGSAISGFGTGAMYGGMAGMMLGPEGAAAGALIGGLIGGITSYTNKAKEEARTAAAAQAATIKGLYTISGTAIDTFGLHVRTFSNVHMIEASKQMSANQIIVDRLANAYKTATDSETKHLIHMIGSPIQIGKKLMDEQSKLNQSYQMFGNQQDYIVKQGTDPNYYTTTGNFNPGKAQEQNDARNRIAILQSQFSAASKKAMDALKIQYETSILGGMSANQARLNLMGQAEAGGFSGLTLESIGNSYKSGQTNSRFANPLVAFNGLIASAGKNIQKVTDTLGIAVSNMKPEVFMKLATSTKGVGHEALNSTANLNAYIQAVKAGGDTYQAGIIQQAQKSGDATSNIMMALNLMNNGVIHTASEFLNAAASINSIRIYLKIYQDQQKSDNLINSIAGGFSNTIPPAAKGPSKADAAQHKQAETRLQQEIKGKQDLINDIQREISVRDQLYNEKQKQLQQDLTLFNLQNKIADARDSGNLLAMADAQNAYNAELANQQALNAKDAADNADQARISAIQAQIDALNAKKDALTNAYQALQNSAASATTATQSMSDKVRSLLDSLATGIKNGKWSTVAEALSSPFAKALEAIGVSTKKIKSVINANLDITKSEIQNAIAAGAVPMMGSYLPPHWFTAKINGVIYAVPDGVKVPGHASGGLAIGPGTGTSDSFISKLSNGEFVIQAQSVSKYGTAMLNAINAGRYTVPSGGSTFSTSNASGSNVNYNISVNVAGSNNSADDIARQVIKIIQREEDTRRTQRSI